MQLPCNALKKGIIWHSKESNSRILNKWAVFLFYEMKLKIDAGLNR